jgi:hypothetical protein
MRHEGFPIPGGKGGHARRVRVYLVFIEDGEVAFEDIPQLYV